MKPIYVRIRESIAEEIRTRPLPAGTQLESEGALAERFGCARMTIAKALQGLVDAGLVVRRRGVGTFVCDPVTTQPTTLDQMRSPVVAQSEIANSTLTAGGGGQGVVSAQDAVAESAARNGVLFQARWRVYNEVRRMAGRAEDIAARLGMATSEVSGTLESLVHLGHVERQPHGADPSVPHYVSVQPAPYLSVQKTMGEEPELHSRHMALEKTKNHIVGRFDAERAGRTDFDYYTINASVDADDVSLHELQSMVLSWIELHRTKRRDVPMTHITFLTTPVHPRAHPMNPDVDAVVVQPARADGGDPSEAS